MEHAVCIGVHKLSCALKCPAKLKWLAGHFSIGDADRGWTLIYGERETPTFSNQGSLFDPSAQPVLAIRSHNCVRNSIFDSWRIYASSANFLSI